MPMQRLRNFLDAEGVRYAIVPHVVAYTSKAIAAVSHTPPSELAKTVIVKLDGKLAMAVLPASRHVDLSLLKEVSGAKDATLVKESEFRNSFPDCEVGAMPPFGNLYGMEVYVAPSLASEPEIAFNAGSHTEVIKLAYADFEKLVKPKPLSCTT